MKVDRNRPNLNAELAERVDAARSAEAKRAGAAAGGGAADRVELSPGAKLAATAVAAATSAPDVRADKVAHAKVLVQSGELGADAGKLADALIDGMLEG